MFEQIHVEHNNECIHGLVQALICVFAVKIDRIIFIGYIQKRNRQRAKQNKKETIIDTLIDMPQLFVTHICVDLSMIDILERITLKMIFSIIR
jgi:hypothetical protein